MMPGMPTTCFGERMWKDNVVTYLFLSTKCQEIITFNYLSFCPVTVQCNLRYKYFYSNNLWFQVANSYRIMFVSVCVYA